MSLINIAAQRIRDVHELPVGAIVGAQDPQSVLPMFAIAVVMVVPILVVIVSVTPLPWSGLVPLILRVKFQ